MGPGGGGWLSDLERDQPIKSGATPLTLPGTTSTRFEVFFQFNDDAPVRFAETRTGLRIDLTEDGQDVEWRDGDKRFRIFLKKKT